ncbi:PAS domain-containing hybrid sensor histidine kinase/response regulator [Actinoplanes aureus]|uniref:histidine kinase n=1 Tax=Actinoplanes aureus TaxID=2792083 RepID=A0A931FZ45_9ACTN|nr:PAS domain S-box protein [Actinoplanes aureus]MBG0564330.1 PAS domain S-box protein [Actinoplanes aureus]
MSRPSIVPSPDDAAQGAVRAVMVVMARNRDPGGSEHDEAFLSAVVRSTADAIVGCDAQGRITAWNPAAERIYGYRSDEVRRRPVTMMYPADVADRDWQVFQKALRGTPTGQLRTVRLRKDGTRVPVRMSFAPIEGVDGSVRGVVSVAHELTDEIRSEARMAALLEATPDAIVGVDRDGRIVFANPSCERLLGYRPDELTGRHARILFADDVRTEMIELRERLFTDPELRARVHTLETRLLRKDGTVLPGETTLSWQEEPEGPLMIAATRDLSELYRAESRLRALIEAVPDAITGVDRHGRIVTANQGTERLLGYPRQQLLGVPYARLLPEEERERLAQFVGAVFASPEPRSVVYADAIRADGTRVPTENTVTRFDTGSEQILLVVSRDITDRVAAEQDRARLVEQVERQRTEQAILRTQRLEALGQLAGGVAHDFNNLLAIITNYADLLGEEMTDLARTDPRQWQPFIDDLARIQQAAQRGAVLTQQLLTFSRRDLNRPEVLAPATVLERLLPTLRTTVSENNDLQLDAGAELWPVLLDPGQLEQILVNLTVNARDAMPGGGLVRITADNFQPPEADPVFHPAPEPGRRYLRLRVADTGTGMTADVAARAFEPFFTTKPKSSGAGLGLAAVYGIVGQAGGCLAMETQPGAGTTMTVLLPATDQPPSDPAERAGTGPDTEIADLPEQQVVLLVDDEEGVRESTARVLTHHGYRVLTAHDGLAALAVAEQHRDEIDVLLTDVIMPRMHGGELAQRVAELIPGIQIIFMSGYAEPLLGAATSDSAVPLLEKPFTITNLLRALRTAAP